MMDIKTLVDGIRKQVARHYATSPNNLRRLTIADDSDGSHYHTTRAVVAFEEWWNGGVGEDGTWMVRVEEYTITITKTERRVRHADLTLPPPVEVHDGGEDQAEESD